VYWVFGVHDGRSVQLVQAIGWAAAAGLIGLIGRRLFGQAAGLLAAACTAVYPPFIMYQGYAGSVYYATENLFIWLLLAMIWWLVADDPPSVRRAAGAGVWLGLATLTRAVTLLFPFALAMAWGCRRPFVAREWARLVVALGLGVGLVVIPWTIRNYTVYHTFVPVTASGGGLVLLGGNNPGSAGDPVDVTPDPQYDWVREIEDPVQRDRAYAKLAVDYWRTLTPGQWARLLINKTFLFWTDFGPNYNIAYGLILPFSWLGLWMSRRQPGVFALHAFVLYNFIFCLVVTAYARMRLPIEPCLILLAAAALAGLAQRLQRPLVSALLLGGWAGLNVALAVWWRTISGLVGVVR
jgi:4-amino-4-deoxy-L-arabinose transferase-like glycosyltransferase